MTQWFPGGAQPAGSNRTVSLDVKTHKTGVPKRDGHEL